MAFNFHFDPVDLPPECKELRQEVRAFLKEEIGWMENNEKEIREKLRFLLNIKRK